VIFEWVVFIYIFLEQFAEFDSMNCFIAVHRALVEPRQAQHERGDCRDQNKDATFPCHIIILFPCRKR